MSFNKRNLRQLNQPRVKRQGKRNNGYYNRYKYILIYNTRMLMANISAFGFVTALKPLLRQLRTFLCKSKHCSNRYR